MENQNKLDELFGQLKAHWSEFENQHSVYTGKGTKAAAGRARKAIQELKKLVTEYKRVSVESTKQ